MADKLFKDYFNERQEDNAIQGNTKILINRGNNVRKIDVDKFATAAQGSLADTAVQPTDLGTMAYEDADDYVDLTTNQNISGVKTFNDNVGIGTTNVKKTLTIELNNPSNDVNNGNGLSGGQTGNGLLMINANSSTDTYANIDFRAGTADGRIAYQYKGNTNEGDFHFITDGSGAFNSVMVIKNNGNVGIGTTSPTAKLDVDGTAFLRDRVASDYITPYSGNELLMLNGVNNHLTIQGNTKITGTLDLNDGSNRTIVGTDAGGTSGNQSAFGYLAGKENTGINQSAFGLFAGRNNTGDSQSAFGRNAGYLNTGVNQSAFGRDAGYLNTGVNQSAFGYFAGRDNIGVNQTAVGYQAGRDNTGDNNIAIGFESSYGNEGDNVLSIGYQAGKGNTQSNRTIIDNDLLPAFASFALAEAAFGTGQSGMTYLYFNTVTNAIEGVRF